MPSNEPYLTFEAGGRSLALPSSSVVEVKRHAEATGVVLVDVSSVLGDGPAEVGPCTCVIIVSLKRLLIRESVGLIVDAATDIASFGPEDLVDAPDFGPHLDLPYLAALARSGEAYAIVLDVDGLLAGVFEETGAA